MRRLVFFACAVALFGCDVGSVAVDEPGASGGSTATGGSGGSSSGSGGAGLSPASGGTDSGTTVTTTGPEARARERAELDAELGELEGLDAAGLRARFPTSFEPAPSYEPSTIAGLDTIQASPLSLSDTELAALAEKGFVVSGNRLFPNFAYGYSTIYMADLPVYVSADSILEAMHRSYDRVLQRLEEVKLIPELDALLTGMRARLAGGVGEELGAEARVDVDLYLAVALSSLHGSAEAAVAGASDEEIGGFVSKIELAEGLLGVDLFGTSREEDFSQFVPRGHYTFSEELKRYFRATMWLGRTDFRLIETLSNGDQIFRRRQLDAMLLVNELVNDELRESFARIDEAVRVFVGEPDTMQLHHVSPLLADVGVASLSEARAVSDATWAQAIFDGGYGLQRISSHVMMNGLDVPGTLPLSLSFALLGQRYVIDSHVFSNVVFDRAGHGRVMRMMPNPLDAAFAVFGNDQAAELLAPDLEEYPYAPDLAAMRILVDHHPPEFWDSNLYNLWLGALRELSPAAVASSADAAALPPTFRSEAWGRRLLNAELASWAELRHDTLLYAKQSYTSGAVCEFPDGYVEPYPEFFQKIVDYATRGAEVAATVAAGTSIADAVASYFENFANVAGRLRDMATHQRTGAPYTQEMLDFINDAVVVDPGCGDPTFDAGWYKSLYFDPQDGVQWSPTIADVHTQPTDEVGNIVGHVLHVGTGDARLMVVVAETCSGPRAYAGLASSYYEHITSDFERLDDPTWEVMVRTQAEVPWFAGIVTR